MTLVNLTTDIQDTLFAQHTGLLSFVNHEGHPDIVVRVVELWDEATLIIPEKSHAVLHQLTQHPHVCVYTSSPRHETGDYKFKGTAVIHRDDAVIRLYKELQKKPPHRIYRLLAVITVECEQVYWQQKDGTWHPIGTEHAANCYKCAKERGTAVPSVTVCGLCGGRICNLHRLGREHVCISCARRFGIHDGWRREILKRIQVTPSCPSPPR